ncbi:DNA (cytosine-5-)-methyltransferase [Neobacillus sp. SAB-20_R2A]|uniref:DNA (cytosine-5-)-methyltransferase n=1 Tax=Neobacillus sp. SAB-20_R2A TaxID=3120519 RepID=UPI003C6E9460
MDFNNNYQNILNGVKFIDLFAGIGGFRIAMESFGAVCVYSSEWDKHAQKTYFENYGEMPEGDITKVKVEDIPAHDILCAGFPCQPFSISGKRMSFKDTRGTLFFDIARIANHHKPKILFMENAKNFATHDNGNTLKTVEETLNEIGYDFWHKVLNASHFGLPQNRERIYMIAIRRDISVKEFKFPTPSFEESCLRDIILPDEEAEKYIINRSDMRIEESKIPGDMLINDFPNKPIRVGTINKGGLGERRIYSDLGHAVTLSAQGGGPGRGTGYYLINGKVRKLAPRECARIQGFPDDFKIPVSDGQAWKQFGNSLPVNVLKHIIVCIIETSIFNPSVESFDFDKKLQNSSVSLKDSRKAGWKDFEIDACEFLNREFSNTPIYFKLSGGSDSKEPDIKIFNKDTNKRLNFTIEAKYVRAQSGQIVATFNGSAFKFSKKSKTPYSSISDKLINVLNMDIEKYSKVTEGKNIPLDCEERLLVDWVKWYYTQKGSKYIISSHIPIGGPKVLFPVEKLDEFFSVSAMYRIKCSGSSNVTLSQLEDEEKNALVKHLMNFNLDILSMKDEPINNKIKLKVIINRAKKFKRRERYFGQNLYISDSGDDSTFYITRRSSTCNANIVFSVDLKIKPNNNHGVKGLEDYIKKNMSI